ncbi:MAG TPA: hypothetical protein VFB69_02855 [Candidatus Dormibacteraeota bacterium]|nr:hypothetical protein [Candidatus Dormibacteraeota bacterium]
MISGIAVAFALTTSSVTATAASNRFDITVKAGYHGAVKLGSWVPVNVDVTNKGEQFDGTLEVSADSSAANSGPPAGVAVYRTPLSLAGGSTKHISTYVSADFPATIDVRIASTGGKVMQSQQTTISTSVSGLLVAVLSDNPTALDSLATVHPGGVSPTVIHLSSADMPDSAVVLRGFDAIALDDFSSDTLTAAQRAALLDYVMQGGSLLLGTGGSWRKTFAGLPDGIAPMQLAGSRVLATAHALGGVSNVEISTGAVAGNATTWLDEGGLPLLVESAVGAGLVEMATFDWAQGDIVASSEANVLLRQTLVRSTYGSPYAYAALNLVGGKGGGPTNSVAFRGGNLSQALGNVPALDLPAWWLIGGLVFVYVLLVGPGNYLALRALRRRALAWITVPAIAIVASGGAYGASLLTKGTSVVANEIAIIHAEPGWARAYSEQYTGIVTPTRGDFEVGIGAQSQMISPIDYFSGPNGALGSVQVNTATRTITLPAMTAFTLRGFATEDVSPAPAITGSAHLSAGRVAGSITNRSSTSFTDGVVISGSAYEKLGAIGPGGTLTFSVTPALATVGGPPTSSQIYPNNLCCGPPAGNSPDVERTNEMRSAILSTLTNGNFGGVAVSIAPIAVLWTSQPFQNVTVNGATPRQYIVSAVVLNLPLAQLGPGTIPAGLINGRLVDVNADITPAGPPGLLMANSGSVTYSFIPSLNAGTRLGSAAIVSSNPYGVKFGPNGAPSSGVLRGQVWNWTTSQWMDVSYSDSGSTTIPDGAVNPTTGEVRLKLSSDGQFATSFLSLTGTIS